MYKLAIVDDDVRIASALREALLEFDEIDSVICSNSGLKFAKDLLTMPPASRPDVIVMDISMGLPDEGIRATRQIKSDFPDIEVIMFTITDEDERIFEAFKAGAMGYLLKSEEPAFILKTITDVKNGGAQMSPGIARKAIQYLAPRATVAKPTADKDEGLTIREKEILDQVAKGLTYPVIANQLFISTQTVKKHMMNIFDKLQVKNKVEALKKTERIH